MDEKGLLAAADHEYDYRRNAGHLTDVSCADWYAGECLEKLPVSEYDDRSRSVVIERMRSRARADGLPEQE